VGLEADAAPGSEVIWWGLIGVAAVLLWMARPWREPDLGEVESSQDFAAPLPLAFLQRDGRRKRPRWSQTDEERDRLRERWRDAAARWERRS